jgi:predicted small secreted protein
VRRRRHALLVLALAATTVAACADDGDVDGAGGDPGGSATTTAPPEPAPTTTAPSDELAPLLLTIDDLPAQFEPSDTVDDTLTTVCAGQDATAGLRATDRAVVGFRSDPPGVAVVQIVLELVDDGAATFVAQADDLLASCDSVPDLSGLAFEYEPVDPDVEALLAEGTDGHAARRGLSVGSGTFVLDLAFFHRGDTGQLVAVIGLDEDPGGLLGEVLAVVLDRP